MSFQQRDFGRGLGRDASTGMLRQGRTSAGEHRQEASAGAHIGRGTSTGGFGRGALRQGYINRGLRQGGFGRGASTFSKYYEFPVTINGNIRLYCGTTRKRRQEKDYKRKQ